MPLNLTETSARTTTRLEGMHDGAHIFLSQYDDSGACAGKWNCQVSFGACHLSIVVPTRATAEAVALSLVPVAIATAADVKDAVRAAQEPEDDGACPTCAGTGEGHADRERCWRCKGNGVVLP